MPIIIGARDALTVWPSGLICNEVARMNFRELTAFCYAMEKFTMARRSLMLPHPLGEAAAIGSAVHEYHLGLHHLPEEELDESTRERIQRLKELIDITRMEEAELSLLQKSELSDLVDELAEVFTRQFYHRAA
jgi:hypothetical protein